MDDAGRARGSDEAARSNPRTTKLLVDEKTHPEEPNKAHKKPKPVWTGQVIERKERERNKHNHSPGKERETVEFIAHLRPGWPGAYRPRKRE